MTTPSVLACPRCGAPGTAPARFCAACGMPLVITGEGDEQVLDAAQERARKVHKAYLDGPLVRVAVARHQAEAELISGLLLEHGVPSVARRSAGFDVPDMMFSGPRDVLVPQAGEEAAREVLQTVEDEHAAATARRHARDGGADAAYRRRGRRWTHTMAWVGATLLAVTGLAPVVVWLAGGFS